MSDTEGRPDTDVRTQPMKTQPMRGVPVTDGHPGSELRDVDGDADRPRPDKDPQTQEDTASGGRAD